MTAAYGDQPEGRNRPAPANGMRSSESRAENGNEESRPSATRSFVKVTVNLPDKTFQDLEMIATEQGITKTEALRRAIGVQKFLRDRIKDGSKILLEDPDKTFHLVHLL